MVPTVIGILRPVVLIPSMIISGLPADQLETIIVHELAHIRRHDFLVNIMQSIMEALFFYHPVVWIISENIRQDREKCCDDYTVRICGQVSLYARALACLSELQITAAVPSVAITGNKKNLLQRVERLINNKKMKINKTERLMAGLILVTSVLVITLSTGATFKPSGFTQVESQIVLPFWDKDPAIPVTDTEPVTEPVAVTAPTAVAEPAAFTATTTISEPATVTAPTIVLPSIPAIPALPADTSHRHHREKMDIKDNTVTREFHNKEGEDTEMKFVIKQGKVEELYVDGQRIPDNEFPRYQKEIEKTIDDLHDMEKDLKHARVELDNVDFDKIREEIKTEMEHFKQHEMIDLQEDMMKLQEEQIKVHLDQHELQAEIERAMKDVQIDHEKMQEEMFKAQEEIKKAMEEFEDGNNELSEEEFEQAMKEMELGMAEAKKAMAMMETVEMQEMMEKALKSVQEIDHENIQKEIEEALKHIEEIDFAQIEKEMQSAMLDMEKTKIDLDKEKNNIDEMIEELEKLELDNK